MKLKSTVLTIFFSFSLLFFTISCSSGSENDEVAEVACCHEDCSDECKDVCEANGHACSIDENDKSCCVAEDGSKLEECCDGKMSEGEGACCSKS